MQTYTRKQLMDITGLLDKTLRWLLSRLEIDPVNTTKTAFGRPVYHYDYSTLHKLHEYIFQQTKRKEEYAKGIRCRGGCNRYFPKSELNTDNICSHCRRKRWLHHELYPDKSCVLDKLALRDIVSIINSFRA